jgi:hypothetical protein
MEQSVIAVLTARNLDEAANSIGVSPKTLLRWQKLPEFARAFREAKTATFRQSLARLQQASGPAVTTLLKILVDPKAPLGSKRAVRITFWIRRGKAWRLRRLKYAWRSSKQRQQAGSTNGEDHRWAASQTRESIWIRGRKEAYSAGRVQRGLGTRPRSGQVHRESRRMRVSAHWPYWSREPLDILEGLNAEETERFLRENGAERFGFRTREDDQKNQSAVET